MQKLTSQELEIQDFVDDCRILYKISLSTIKSLLYSEMSDNFTPEVLSRISSDVENITSLYENMSQLKMKIHPHLHSACSLQTFKYEIWMRRTLFNFDALLSSMKKIIQKLLKLYINDSLIAAIRLINSYNVLIMIYNTASYDITTSKSEMLNHNNRKQITIHRILKIIAHDRTEECAYMLIVYLMGKYSEMEKINYLNSDLTDIEEDNSKNCDDDAQHESDNTSIFVYKTLTQYASPPKSTSGTSINSRNYDHNQMQDIATSAFITAERKRLDLLFSSIIVTNPYKFFTEQELKISKRSGCAKICSKVKLKLMETYEHMLWQNIGIVGEHMLLWWTDFGLGRKNQLVSQKFNAWLKQYYSSVNICTTIQPTIHSLLDSLCCYITSTSWDELFTQTLISVSYQHSKHSLNNIGLGTKTGHFFSDMLYDMVFLTNSCEGSNWTQQDLENLPLVEQIPLLHRLDHSIHSVRVWALGRAKHLTNCWNMEQFFRVTHVDINASLYALSLLKITQNLNSLENEKSHFIVCSKMKAKLVSEVNVNIEKLQEVPNCSLKILASICKITSLAYLKICFPPQLYWQQRCEIQPKSASNYVEKYLDEILKPILLASQNLPLPIQKSVSKLILEILCEAWLDHIYNFRIKFSEWGAIQLLVDFGAIQTWIKEKSLINCEIRMFLTADEILRRCEGVGRLLLRHPGESIVMNSEQKTSPAEETQIHDIESIPKIMMPPEMYVPNQEKWLELRLDQQKLTISTCC